VEPLIYRFTDEERDRAIRVGNARQEFHDRRSTPNAYGLNADWAESARINRVGALAELCVASWLGVAAQWVEVTEDYKALRGDVVPGLEVRSSSHPRSGVLLHPRDPDDRVFVGVRTNRANEGWVEFVGWIVAADGKVDRWWPGANPKRPCFMVPPEALCPMEELPVGFFPGEKCGACSGVLSGPAPWQRWCGCPF
jgi:hypothetical protein